MGAILLGRLRRPRRIALDALPRARGGDLASLSGSSQRVRAAAGLRATARRTAARRR